MLNKKKSKLSSTVRLSVSRKKLETGNGKKIAPINRPALVRTPIRLFDDTPTKKKKTNKNSNELFLELLDSVYDAIIITDLQGNIITVNERAIDYFTHKKEIFTSMNIEQVISGADPNTQKVIHETLQRDRRVFIECFCNGKKEQFPAEVTVSFIHLSEACELCYFIRNITYRRKTEGELETAQKELLGIAHKAGMADVATGILHDIGNILNSINVSCETIKTFQKTTATNGLQRLAKVIHDHRNNLITYFTENPKSTKIPHLLQELCNTISSERERLIEETNRLQEKITLIKEVVISQQEYAKQGLFFEEVSFSDILKDVLNIEHSHIITYGVTIKTEYPKNLILYVQKTKITYILINLIKNAIEAMKNIAEGERIIHCSAYKKEEKIFINIKDNGIGINPKNLEKIFSHGFTTKVTGHGFGLHFCVNFLRESGGDLQVFSNGEGKGATFTIIIPDNKVKGKRRKI